MAVTWRHEWDLPDEVTESQGENTVRNPRPGETWGNPAAAGGAARGAWRS